MKNPLYLFHEDRWFLIWTNLNTRPKIALLQVWLKLDGWFWKRKFLNFVNVFSLFRYLIISPKKKGVAFIWTNFNPLHLRMVCAEFCWNWPRRRFLKVVNVISLFCNYLLLGKGNRFIWTNLNPLYLKFFMPSLVKIGPVILEMKSKIGQVYTRTDRQTDNGRQAIRKAHLRFQLRWDKKWKGNPEITKKLFFCFIFGFKIC